MACLDCSRTKPIPSCTTSLILGTVTSLSTAVYIYVRNLTSGKLYRQAVTSSVAGLVTLDKTEPSSYFYTPNHAYEIWVTLVSATDIDSRLILTIGTSTATCLNPVFEKPTDNDNLNITYASQTVAIDE